MYDDPPSVQKHTDCRRSELEHNFPVLTVRAVSTLVTPCWQKKRHSTTQRLEDDEELYEAQPLLANELGD